MSGSGELPTALAAVLALPATPEQLASLHLLSQPIQLAQDQYKSIVPILNSVITSGRAPPLVLKWAATLIHLILSNTKVPSQVTAALALQSLGGVSRLLTSQTAWLEKLGLQTFASIYPLLFREATNGSDESLWINVNGLKTAALQLWRTGGMGAKLASIKVLQRIIQTQTRGTADPRLQRTAEPNLSQVRTNHPYLRINVLESEAHKLLEETITILFTSPSADLISSLTTAMVGLVKLRPGLAQLIVTALVNWTPAALDVKDPTPIRSAEKAVRIALNHLLKTSHASKFAPQIQDFLGRQAARMETAAAAARQQRDRDVTRKRQLIAEELERTETASKRRKITEQTAEAARDQGKKAFEVFEEAARRTGGDRVLAGLDVRTIGVRDVVELVIVCLQDVEGSEMTSKISDIKRSIAGEAPRGARGPMNPLQVDLGDEELDLQVEAVASEPEEKEEEVEAPLEVGAAIALPELAAPTQELPSDARTSMIESALKRICAAGAEGASPAVWVPLVSRLITRGLGQVLEEEDDGENEERRGKLREVLFEFVIDDLRARMEFARVWLNEEWYVDGFKTTEGRPYERWLRRILAHLVQYSTNRDQAFAQFIVDLPVIPRDAVARIGEMCMNPNQEQIGYTALRDLALLRPPSRLPAVDALLTLTSHPNLRTRKAAINTVRRWVPEVPVLSSRIEAFSKHLFSRLEVTPPSDEVKEEKAEDDEADMEMDMDDEATPPPVLPYGRVDNGAIVDGLPPPTTDNQIVQHVELIFSLSVKSPDLLAHVFETYPRLQPTIQESLQKLIEPVIKHLGVDNATLINLISICPPGCDDLILRIVTILADKGRLPGHLVQAIRTMVSGRDNVNPRLYKLIVAECDKTEIKKYIPRIVTLLNNTPEEKAPIRSIFLSVMIAPSQQFGSSSNAPRTRQSELITPVELMTLLHTHEKEIGLKQAIEAISICFTMSDAFRQETWAAFMTVISDEPVIPVLFMRTVLQALSTYKTLSAYVSNNLLTKLISREVWNTPPLWEGFIRAAKATAPNCYNSLLLLPPDKLLDLVTKQPTLRTPLRQFALKKVGPHLERVQPQLEVLGEEELPEPGEVEMVQTTGEDSEAPEVAGSEAGGGVNVEMAH